MTVEEITATDIESYLNRMNQFIFWVSDIEFDTIRNRG